MMREFAWRLLAWFVCLPSVTDWLIRRAQGRPYSDIVGPDGSTYMVRGWVFNPYPAPGAYRRKGWRDWLPSVRVHHIKRPDVDRHLHDHPWNARTIIMRGWYHEVRPVNDLHPKTRSVFERWAAGAPYSVHEYHHRRAGYTGRLLFGQFHRIAKVAPEGAWTLFFTWRYRGTWGFDVDGVKVPHREYLENRK